MQSTTPSSAPAWIDEYEVGGWGSESGKLCLTRIGPKKYIVHYKHSHRALATFLCGHKKAREQFLAYRIKDRLLGS